MSRDEGAQLHQELWKSQEQDSMQIEMEEVRTKARRRETVSVRAYWAVMGLVVLFAAGFVRDLIVLRAPWLIFGTAWALSALCWIGWRLIRNGPTIIRPAEPCLDFLRRELSAKREGLLWIRRFPVLLFPAIVVLWWGGGPVLGASYLGVHSGWLLGILKGPALLIVMALALAFVWFAFSREVRKVEREIEELSRE